MARIDGIVFDKDGTLFDFQATWGLWTEGFIEEEAQGDASLRTALADVLGFDLANRGFHPDSPVIAATTGEVAAMVHPYLPRYTRDGLRARMDARAMSIRNVEAAPLLPLFSALKARGLKLGIATNDTEAPARAHLAAAGITHLLDFVAGFDSGWGGKPAPGQLLAFAQTCNLDPARCAMVGDSLHDLHAARAAGMVAVGVLTGMADEATLDQAADVVLASIADLPAWLDEQTAMT
jgi:phosphoglycolate phosphatase